MRCRIAGECDRKIILPPPVARILHTRARNFVSTFSTARPNASANKISRVGQRSSQRRSSQNKAELHLWHFTSSILQDGVEQHRRVHISLANFQHIFWCPSNIMMLNSSSTSDQDCFSASSMVLMGSSPTSATLFEPSPIAAATAASSNRVSESLSSSKISFDDFLDILPEVIRRRKEFAVEAGSANDPVQTLMEWVQSSSCLCPSHSQARKPHITFLIIWIVLLHQKRSSGPIRLGTVRLLWPWQELYAQLDCHRPWDIHSVATLLEPRTRKPDSWPSLWWLLDAMLARTRTWSAVCETWSNPQCYHKPLQSQPGLHARYHRVSTGSGVYSRLSGISQGGKSLNDRACGDAALV